MILDRLKMISAPRAVSMAEEWFDITVPNHFWIRRRFEVLKNLAGSALKASTHLGEVGCGNGLLQQQLEKYLQRGIDGFDLNMYALINTFTERSILYCYDILDRRMYFNNTYDALILFDVLEHIPDEDLFLSALKQMLIDNGRLIINVPAGMYLYSVYDTVAGHIRRYSMKQLSAILQRNGFAVERMTYWGLPLVPVLLLRKVFLRNVPTNQVIKCGMKPSSELWNTMFYVLSRVECIRLSCFGTSVMAICKSVD